MYTDRSTKEYWQIVIWFRACRLSFLSVLSSMILTAITFSINCRYITINYYYYMHEISVKVLTICADITLCHGGCWLHPSAAPAS
jgi:uncharacterized membrane protein